MSGKQGDVASYTLAFKASLRSEAGRLWLGGVDQSKNDFRVREDGSPPTMRRRARNVSELCLDKHSVRDPRPGNPTAKDSGVAPRELSDLQGLPG